MKTINGSKVTVSMVTEFDFTREEADRFLATNPDARNELMNELLSTKNPNPESYGSHRATQLYDAIGKAMVGWREQELKQLGNGPEFTLGDEP